MKGSSLIRLSTIHLLLPKQSEMNYLEASHHRNLASKYKPSPINTAARSPKATANMPLAPTDILDLFWTAASRSTNITKRARRVAELGEPDAGTLNSCHCLPGITKHFDGIAIRAMGMAHVPDFRANCLAVHIGFPRCAVQCAGIEPAFWRGLKTRMQVAICIHLPFGGLALLVFLLWELNNPLAPVGCCSSNFGE
jgi:hypothetical protein